MIYPLQPKFPAVIWLETSLFFIVGIDYTAPVNQSREWQYDLFEIPDVQSWKETVDARYRLLNHLLS